MLVSALAACAVWSADASAAQPRVRIGAAPRLPSGARLAGAMRPSARLALTIALRPRNPSALHAFATAVSTPGSADFRRYLSVSQFARRYGATATQIAAVRSALVGAGMTVTKPIANHLTLEASATTAQVQRTFATKLSRVRLAGGRAAFTDTVAPTIGAAIARDVQGVIGLDSLASEQPAGVTTATVARHPAGRAAARANVVTGGPQPCAAPSAVANSYTADTIASAYDFPGLYAGGDFGAGQTVALFELGPYNPADVTQYQDCYGTSAEVENVGVDNPPAFTAGDNDNEEASDVEQVIGLAPQTRILVYQAPRTQAGALDNWSAIVSQDRAAVVSSSWSSCETRDAATTLAAENTLFEEAAAQGQSIYAASGDSGSAACEAQVPSDTSLSVLDPGAQPFVTGVGGTALYTGHPLATSLWAPGQPLEQALWNDLFDASTGGLSSVWGMPVYQSSASDSVGVVGALSSMQPCDQDPLCREVPDVSADADQGTEYAMFFEGGWRGFSGTSMAAPLWAALTALVNDDSTCRGVDVGFANPALYRIASTDYADNFSDITAASPFSLENNNDLFGDNGGLYPVTTGYDMVTGLGTPLATTLAGSLCAIDSPVFDVTVTDPGGQSSTAGASVSLQVKASDSGSAALTYSASGLPAGLAIDPSSGLISGTPTSAGSSTVTITATDNFHNLGSVTFNWTVAQGAASIASVGLSGLALRRPELAFTVAAGASAPALTSLAVSLPGAVRLAAQPAKLAAGITVTAGGAPVAVTPSASGRMLTLTFAAASEGAAVTIGAPALTVGPLVAELVKRHLLATLDLGFVMTDTSGATSTADVTVGNLS